jgi:hypothetical protein
VSPDDSFDLIGRAVASGGPASALDLLARKFLADKQYPRLFETRLMQKRLELGLPLIQLGAIDTGPEPARTQYESGVRKRRVRPGGCSSRTATFNTLGRISALSAIGKRSRPRSRPLNTSINRASRQYFEQFPDLDHREECLILLVRTLHAELAVNLKQAIEQRELEPCEYGAHLSPQFKMRGEPPFEDIYRDHAIYLHGLLQEDLDGAIEHFKSKIVAQDDPMSAIRSAQVLVGLLVRRERYQEAMQISLQHLSSVAPDQLACPTLFQLCQLAGDSERLKVLARERGDLLSFVAGAIQSS